MLYACTFARRGNVPSVREKNPKRLTSQAGFSLAGQFCQDSQQEKNLLFIIKFFKANVILDDVPEFPVSPVSILFQPKKERTELTSGTFWEDVRLFILAGKSLSRNIYIQKRGGKKFGEAASPSCGLKLGLACLSLPQGRMTELENVLPKVFLHFGLVFRQIYLQRWCKCTGSAPSIQTQG